ncbi:hypothetical protein Taro_052436 [Colocasia esculenta]|uniref:GIR1-like zinc ribbon domain-containing protein n=1 Tax=Colocasia esculenta TaxID=4460 RepID=A0A843XJN5_COLES|nr:hypothetical protein [Colocasia esculenta]
MAPLRSSVLSPPRQAVPQLHNLLSEHPAATLDLRLRPSAAVTPAAAGYESVCTLDKVRSALERAQREPPLRKLLPHSAAGPASPASSSTTTSSAKRLREATQDEEGERESKSPSSSSSSSSVVVQGREDRSAAAGMAAAGCPSCLLYVLISRSDPRCPRCNAAVPLPPPAGKRPRIDLNVASSSTAPETAAAAATPLTTVNFF